MTDLTLTPPTRSGTAKPRLRVAAWRDYAPGTESLPGMALGSRESTGSPAGFAQELWDAGARKVVLPEAVDTTVDDAVAWICLVRELTARAVFVDWELVLAGTLTSDALSHLHPPRTLTGEADPDRLARWRTEYFMDRHVWRQGPGFLQIRDRRYGELRRFTVTDPAYVTAVRLLDAGCHDSEVDPAVLAHLESEELAGRIGERVWLHAFRHRRWLQAETMV